MGGNSRGARRVNESGEVSRDFEAIGEREGENEGKKGRGRRNTRRTPSVGSVVVGRRLN